MEIRLEDIKAAIMRVQGQLDVWQQLYKATEEAERAKETANDTASKS